MITTNNLPNIGEMIWMGRKELVRVKKPQGKFLPDEWRAKLGEHLLPEPFTVIVDDVDLRGPALVGFRDGDVILDTAYFGRLDLWERNYNHFSAALACGANPPIDIELGVSLGNVWSMNYFHWILDSLPKLEMLRGYSPTILLGHNPPPFVIEYLKETKRPYQIIDTMHARVEHLMIPTTRRYEGIPYPSAVESLRSIALQNVDAHKILYITRNDTRSRKVVNERELLELLGIESTTLTDMPVSLQRTMFAGSDLVLGPHGAGLVNIVFGQPKVVEFVSPEYTNPCLWLLGVVAGCDYRFVVGRPEGGFEDIRINPDMLADVLSDVDLASLREQAEKV